MRTSSRRTVLTGLTASALVAGTAAPAHAETGERSPGRHHDWAGRAALSWQALLDHFAVGDGSGLLHEQFPVAAGDPKYSYEWPFSQAHVAALDLTGIPGAGRRYRDDLIDLAAAQQYYWNPTSTTGLPGFASGPMPPYLNGGDLFYDDNEWVGLLDVQQFAMTGDRRALAEARKISDLVESGWDTDPTHAAPGGVFWTQAPWSDDRNTVSNMPGAELALRLFQFTRERRYLDRALKYYTWTNTHLQQDDGLYTDHLDLQGVPDPTVWSYNQGVPVGVNVLLFQATRDRRYLREAQRIARASLEFFVAGGRVDDHPPYFNSIWFKNLLLLESVTGGHTYRDATAGYAQRVWDTKRQPSGLFRFPAGDSHGTTTLLLEQAAVVQVFAVLAWKPSDHDLLY
ncbi:glycoside hydrolase family 76 protein [Kineococcus rhizosphaerae]|uniref:Glycosyl hydrolase family 76 n=1 Tax=Kineococcus rhizosphaerae TaxID=559628 RepID=A0A2T0R7A3_9ACTN|nr:glycoside hydrolase family 76 protein [Kineococcus rhizosphaerae]PRY17048.1 glycosyl hydrolase family 76 [Kineococcus rhizosphaerae]